MRRKRPEGLQFLTYLSCYRGFRVLSMLLNTRSHLCEIVLPLSKNRKKGAFCAAFFINAQNDTF